MRILLVEPDQEDNGALRVSLDRASRWVEMGATVDVLFVSAFAGEVKISVPGNLRPIFANRRLARALWMLPNALRKIFGEARRADVIVAGREIASGLLIAAFLSRLWRKPLAVTIHSHVEAALAHHGSVRHGRHVLHCLRSANLLAPVSHGLVAGLCGIGLSPQRIKVVENGLDATRVKTLARAPSEVDLGTIPTVVGLGRLSFEKGFDLLIEAHARALRDGARPHRLLLIGDGPERATLMALTVDLGVAATVSFAGHQPNPYAVLARSSVLVVPSRWEGFTLALAEGIILGTPAIASNCVSGPARILDNGRFGDLFPVGGTAELADAIKRHLADPERLRAAARAGSHFVSETFAAERAARQHLGLLGDLVAGQCNALMQR